MAGSGDPCRSAELTDLVGCITALEAAVIVALGQIALAGADTAEEANATLAELRTHCDQVREALRAAAEADGKLSGIPDQAFTKELARIFGALRFAGLRSSSPGDLDLFAGYRRSRRRRAVDRD